jgi:selenocysteine lyase/cysteine desulfurase
MDSMVDVTRSPLAAAPAAAHEDTLAEARQLIADLRNAAQDAPQLARQFAETLQTVVEDYSREFEQRAEALLARLETCQ